MDIEQILKRLKTYGQQLRQKWWKLAIAGLIGGILLGLYIAAQPKWYTAIATFHPEVGAGSSGLSALTTDPMALIFGGGSATNNKGTMQMIGVLSSRRISEAVAADTVELNGQQQILANVMWASLEEEASISDKIYSWFVKSNVPSQQSKILGIGRMLRNSIELESNDYGFIEMKLGFHDAGILELIAYSYIDQLKAYYQSQKTEKAGQNVAFFEYRSDSVKTEIDKAAYALASYMDKNKYRINAVDDIYTQEKELEIELLSQLYQAQMLSLEQAKGQQQQETPIIQVLDYPDQPYDLAQKNALLFVIIGGILGALIASFFVVSSLLREDYQQLKALVWEQILASSQPSKTDGDDSMNEETLSPKDP